MFDIPHFHKKTLRSACFSILFSFICLNDVFMANIYLIGFDQSINFSNRSHGFCDTKSKVTGIIDNFDGVGGHKNSKTPQKGEEEKKLKPIYRIDESYLTIYYSRRFNYRRDFV